MKKYFNWLQESNRPNHLKMGAIILALWVPFCLLLGMTVCQSAITGLATVSIAMASCELKDKAHGGAWDWLDILAGVLVPIAVCLLVVISSLIFIW